ncbi:SRPBCC domain-containing protein [Bacillus sp. DX1.1]|uniref:SRPBCC family protein n=1 Tax=unclassified Bacillus (in: firmicutes) TaxID=185979 RepID=UPI002570D4B0|nr:MULTISPECIES: SRPBCC domain-containing protein [unclassified Bacillus (in: firmicutes)]MDM5155048.1 SRPBCC domain-containing protein [Bacillus sp. DX1.1]WJE83908.1 SRPBCC domain-containing protein [Bacillus sp. DX3.1]
MNEKHIEENKLIITRIFDAPRDLVFKMWTDSEHLKHWWGPKGLTMHIAKLDLCSDGVFHYSMKSPDGQEMWGKFVYREISAPDKLVFINSFSDEEGNTVRAPFSPTWPLEIQNTLIFSEEEGKTKLIMQGTPVSATEEEYETFRAAHDGVKQGFAGTFEQLADYIK